MKGQGHLGGLARQWKMGRRKLAVFYRCPASAVRAPIAAAIRGWLAKTKWDVPLSVRWVPPYAP